MDSEVGGDGAAGGAAIALEGIAKTYGEHPAVHDVSVTVGKGEFFTILGPSGSGKTTTLMMIAGFTEPTRGEIRMDGRALTWLPPQQRDIGMVFQNYALFPHLTVFDNLAFPLRVRGVAKPVIAEKVGAMLDIVRLQGLAGRMPHQLSGGQQQRVALARALVFDPRLVLLDEPLGALDKKLRSQMQSEIKHIQRRLRLTVIYITHDQEEALTMSDRVAVMNRGRIEQIGSPDDLYERPANAFVADFLGESNFIEADVAGDQGAGRYGVEAAGGLRFAGVGQAGLRAGQRVLAAMRPEKLLIGAPSGPEANAATGDITEIVYAGDALRYHVRLGPGIELMVKVQNQPGRVVHRVGDRMTLAWSVADTRLFEVARDA